MEWPKSKGLLKMRVVTCALVICLIILFVYSVNVGALIRGSVDFIKVNDGYIEDVDNSIWTYVCNAQSQCTRRKAAKGEIITNLETCNMICAQLQLWPKPTTIDLYQNISSPFNKSQITISINANRDVTEDLKTAAGIFMNNLPSVKKNWVVDEDTSSLKIDINVSGSERKLTIDTNETYSLTVTKNENISSILISISAPTYFGARHALETLSQLIWLDNKFDMLSIVHDVRIFDSPKFPHRGLMVDTARNYFPVEQLKKVVDGMAASKLNVFHLHLTDSVSFPIVLPNNRKFSKYGSYGPDMIYNPEDIRDLIEYSRIRGIRVILEIDAPSHVNEGWNQIADNLVICGENDVFNGHLNPENNQTLKILESVYEDLFLLGTYDDMFHIGGDEVNLSCWMNLLPDEQGHPPDIYSYWANFTNKIFDTVKSANGGKLPKHIVLWSSPLTDFYINSLKYKDNVVVQYWYGRVDDILTSGHKVIFSTVGRWYLDCGFGSWKPSEVSGVCDPYTPWQTFYKYSPWSEYYTHAKQILGGEACLWTEQVSVDTLETRIWPRAAAFAERLWSDPLIFQSYDVATRLDAHNKRLRKRGIKTAAVWPRWCSLNPGKC